MMVAIIRAKRRHVNGVITEEQVGSRLKSHDRRNRAARRQTYHYAPSPGRVTAGKSSVLAGDALETRVPADSNRRRSVKYAIRRKSAVGSHDMEVRVVVGQVAVGVHANHQPRLRLRYCQQDAEALDDHAGGHAAQIPAGRR